VLWVLIFMVLALVLAAAVAAYVAFPRRGVELPAVPALGHALDRGARALPVLEEARAQRQG
jgi:hypothetical protein